MTICDSCRTAADGSTPELRHCSVCDRPNVSVYRTDVPLEEQRVVVHKLTGTRIRCQGSRKPPVMKHVGHDRCNGCPCQHRPRGSWNGG